MSTAEQPYDGIREVLDEASTAETPLRMWVEGMAGGGIGAGRVLVGVPDMVTRRDNNQMEIEPVTVSVLLKDSEIPIQIRIDHIVAAQHYEDVAL